VGRLESYIVTDICLRLQACISFLFKNSF